MVPWQWPVVAKSKAASSGRIESGQGGGQQRPNRKHQPGRRPAAAKLKVAVAAAGNGLGVVFGGAAAGVRRDHEVPKIGQ